MFFNMKAIDLLEAFSSKHPDRCTIESGAFDYGDRIIFKLLLKGPNGKRYGLTCAGIGLGEDLAKPFLAKRFKRKLKRWL